MGWSRKIWCLATLSLVVACGGAYRKQTESSGGSESGGSSATNAGSTNGGSTTTNGGTGISPGPQPCSYNGQSYDSGSDVDIGGCPCRCNDGELGCAALPCANKICLYHGQAYQPGQSFPDADGCNTCSCGDDGSVQCTLIFCTNDCSVVESTYSAHIDAASGCASDADCDISAPGSLTCGCPRWLNSRATTDLMAAKVAAQQYSSMDCAFDVACAPCAPLGQAYCNASGVCSNRSNL